MTKTENKKCHYCGNEQFEVRRVRYIYSREGKHLYVPDLPADVCQNCGMIYYHGPALLKVEKRFNAIYENKAQPDRYTSMPVMDYA